MPPAASKGKPWDLGWQHFEAKVQAGLPNSTIEANDDEVGDSSTGHQCAGEVQGIESPQGLVGKRASRPIQDLLMQLDQMPVSARPRQDATTIYHVAFFQFFERLGPDQYSISFDQGEYRS